MSALPAPIRTDEVSVTPTAVYVVDLVEADPDVVRVATDAADPAEAVHNCLRVGAKALRVANTAVDVDMVERSFGDLTERLDAQVGDAVGRITDTANGLLDGESGALNVVLRDFRAEIDTLLGDTFDPDSKTSVVSTIEALVAGVVARAVDGVRALVAPEGDESPLAQLRVAILAGVKDEIDGVVREVRDVSEKLGISAAVAVEHDRTSAKGFDFEDVVDERIAVIAAAHCDAHEQVGNETGSTGSKVGDEVVTVNRDATGGATARFVLEVKARKVPLRKIIAELDEALENREASAAIAVFDSQEHAPTAVAFHIVDENKAIVVLDGDDDGALKLAYMWARWTARRQVAGEAGDGIDAERVRARVDEAQRALGRLTTIKRAHSTARKAIDQAASEAAALVEDVEVALAALEAELDGAQ